MPHRPGQLHQSNKPFKSKHASKGQLRAQSNGKVQRKPLKSSAASSSADFKVNRRNAAKLQRQRVRAERLLEHRFFAQRQGRDGGVVPKVVAVLPLSDDVCAKRLVERLGAASISSDVTDTVSTAMFGDKALSLRQQLVDVREPQSQRFSFLCLDRPQDQSNANNGNEDDASMMRFEEDSMNTDVAAQSQYFMDVLSAVQVADYVLVLTSAVEEVDALGTALLEAIAAQGAPSMVASIAVEPN